MAGRVGPPSAEKEPILHRLKGECATNNPPSLAHSASPHAAHRGYAGRIWRESYSANLYSTKPLRVTMEIASQFSGSHQVTCILVFLRTIGRVVHVAAQMQPLWPQRLLGAHAANFEVAAQGDAKLKEQALSAAQRDGLAEVI